MLRYQAGYGYTERKHLANEFRLGEGLVGQCAREKQRILLTDVPGDYVTINSGLGESPPLNIIVLPILFEGSVRAVVELASFSRFSATHQAFLDQLTETIGLVLNTIEANTLTENLLDQAQSQAQELQSRAGRLAEQNIEVERKNQEVELAKALVEEKAEQLAVSSKYKSEFFSNMSHELRTPLNSLLILAGELKDNADENLTDAQVQYASVIHSSGSDLLRLLNDILDLAKVESGTVNLDVRDAAAGRAQGGDRARLPPRRGAEGRGVQRRARPRRCRRRSRPTPAACGRCSRTCSRTPSSSPSAARDLRSTGRRRLEPANDDSRDAAVIAISVADTGIGITSELQQRIFEAFAQADGSTARQYGGTGLGLSISRELVQLLGGEITLTSAPDEGSTFTVYLPSRGRRGRRRARRHRRAAPMTCPEPPARRRRCGPSGAGDRARRHEGAGRRRRHPQHLRPDHAARARRARGDLGRGRRGGARAARAERPTSTSCSSTS